MGSVQILLAIVKNKQYWLYLVNVSNMIAKLFDIGFACNGTLYTHVENVSYRHKKHQLIQNKVSLPQYIAQFLQSVLLIFHEC